MKPDFIGLDGMSIRQFRKTAAHRAGGSIHIAITLPANKETWIVEAVLVNNGMREDSGTAEDYSLMEALQAAVVKLIERKNGQVASNGAVEKHPPDPGG